MAVLRAFSDAQKQSLSLSEALGKVEIRIGDLRRELLRAETAAQESRSACLDAETRAMHMESKLSLAQQRCKLFEGVHYIVLHAMAISNDRGIIEFYRRD